MGNCAREAAQKLGIGKGCSGEGGAHGALESYKTDTFSCKSRLSGRPDLLYNRDTTQEVCTDTERAERYDGVLRNRGTPQGSG